MQVQLDAQNNVHESDQSSRVPLALRKQTLIHSAIAMLSDREITQMSRQDLLDALRMAQFASPRSEATNIDNMEVAELQRVFAIVRDYFRKQVNRKSPAKAWNPEFN